MINDLNIYAAHINVIAEIGINHNGSIDLCKKMIKLSKLAGCNYVKIQKRNPDICVPENQKQKRRDTPWGEMSYLEYKHKIEFNEFQIKELAEFCKKEEIGFFASVWDLDSVKIMSKYCDICKIGSPCITDLELCKAARDAFDFLIISTGMSTEEEIEKCISICCPDVIMHTNSTYPSPVNELNLRYIEYLKNKWGNKKEIGYSGHEEGIYCTLATIGMGVSWIERHITLDKTMWGSDHKASLDPLELFELLKGIREIESAMKYKPQPRILRESEKIKKESLRK
jgi:N-acetylneuraminate synthase